MTQKIVCYTVLLCVLLVLPACSVTPPKYPTSNYLRVINNQFVETEYGTIHYVKKGEGKDTIIFVHGGCSWLYSFHCNIDPLAEKFTVFAFDFPGSGYSTYTEKMRFDFDGYAKALLAFMDSQNIESAHLAGDCWGGRWALYFAISYPERVKDVIIANSPVYSKYEIPGMDLLKVPILGEMALFLVNENSIREHLERCYYHKDMVTKENVREFAAPLFVKDSLNVQLRTIRKTRPSELISRLHEIQKPVLIVWSKNDGFYDIKCAYDLKRDIPNSELLIVEESGHNIFDDSYEKMNKIIADFCSKPTE